MPRISLLGVPLDALTMQQAVARLREMLTGAASCHVMTPNSEMLVEASRNAAFKALLNRTALNVPDSAGLLWMARWTGQRLPERVAGVDLVQRLCAELDTSFSVFLLGGAPGVAEKAAEILRASNPQLHIAGTYAGSPSDADVPAIIDRINAAKPHLLLVAYGAPKQDLWIDKHLRNLPSVRVAMGVGGTFDFLAGTRKRAPVFFQQLSLEWLWRLGREPRRLKRIVTAVVVFPWLVLVRGREKPNSQFPSNSGKTLE